MGKKEKLKEHYTPLECEVLELQLEDSTLVEPSSKANQGVNWGGSYQ